jgi:hypothetical protein
MTEKHIEELTNEIEAELKEAKLWFGSWDELRKVIDRLEDNENEAAYERHTSGGYDAWSGGFADNH